MMSKEGIIQISNEKVLVGNKKFRFPIQPIALWVILILLTADAIYSAWYGINMNTREKCIIYKTLPRWIFLVYEFVFELFFVVVAGTFAGVVVEKYFKKFKWLVPKNQLIAFLYASFVPVCSCSTIPIIETMKQKMSFRTIMTFVTAAPLLNPYVIFLSFSLLGFEYGVLRITGALVLSIVVGQVTQLVYKKMDQPAIGLYSSCQPNVCSKPNGTIYEKTWNILNKILPYLLVAGAVGIIFEITGPLKLIESLPLNNGIVTLVILVTIGTVIYLCNGADILFLSPLLLYTDLGMGSAIAFSLTSTGICASSIIMLSKFIGKKLTGAVVAVTLVLTLLIGVLIDSNLYLL